MVHESTKTTVIETSGTNDQLGCKERVCSYSQVCTFMVRECLMTDKSDSGSQEDKLYWIYQAYCVNKNSVPLASKDAFREIAHNMGFEIFQDTDGALCYRGLFFKPQVKHYLREVKRKGELS